MSTIAYFCIALVLGVGSVAGFYLMFYLPKFKKHR